MKGDLRAHLLAHQLNEMKKIIHEMDLDYIKKCGQEMIDQGNWQDSAAVLYPMNPLEKNDLLRTMGKTLLTLGDFVELLRKCDEGKKEVKKAEDAIDNISKMFM